MELARPYIHVHGVQKSVTQKLLTNIFEAYGKINLVKIFDKGFAHIYFDTLDQAQSAVRAHQKDTKYPWRVYIGNGISKTTSTIQSEELNSNPETDTMASRADLSQLTDDYVDIHGRPLNVMKSADGEIYISLKDIRATGYHIFHKDNYDTVLIDRKQVIREFYNNLLGEARKFLLHHQINFVDEKVIMDAIEKARGSLLNGHETLNFEKPSVEQNSFSINRTVQPDENKVFKISTKVEPPQKPIISPPSSLRPPNAVPFDLSINSSKNKYLNTSINQQFDRPKPFGNQNGTYRTGQANNFNTSESINRQPNKYSNNYGGSQQNKTNNSYVRNNKPSYNENSANDTSDKDSVKSVKNLPKTETQGPLLTKPKETIKPISLTNEFQEAVVTHIEENGTFWVNLKSNENSIIEIMEILLDGDSQKIIDATVGSICIAQFEEEWYRSLIVEVKPIKVFYVDYGNVSVVKFVKSMIPSLSKYPSQAVKIQINDLCGKKIELQTELNIKPLKQLDDGSYLCTLNENEKVASTKPLLTSPKPIDKPPVQKFLGVPTPLQVLKNGDKVMVIGENKGTLLVKTKECISKLKEINQYIMEHKAVPLSEVVEKQIVLSKKEDSNYRAVVQKTKPDIVIKYLDTAGEDVVTLDKLKTVNEQLAKAHQTVLSLPKIKGVDSFNDKAGEVLYEAIINKTKLDVELVNGVADLIYPDGTKFTDKIKEEPGMINFEDMPIYEPSLGTNTYMVYSTNTIKELTLLPTGNKETDWLAQFNLVEDTKPYKPQESEMCVALFEDMWSRGAVLEISDELYTIFFVDYGNIEFIKAHNIRRFPKGFEAIPILGIQCELLGLPDTEEVNTQLKKLCHDGAVYDVEFVKKDNEGKYFIRIPEIEKILKK